MLDMIIVRNIRKHDLDGVLELAKLAYPGMTTLPPDVDVLARKIDHAITSIESGDVTPRDQLYFLVMEDSSTGQLIGTAAIIACLGADAQFYSYKLNKVTHSCKELNKKVSVETLNLSNHFEGFAEVASLYLHPDFRKNGNGKFLARSRYLFMAQFRERFPESVMADIRGYYDEHGRSPFWQAVGQHFFEMEFADADLYGATNGNQFIADLMPKHPLYVNLLPESAQTVIGQPNEKSKPAFEMLKAEGFRWNGHVDIFDGSPSIDARIDDMKSIRESKVVKVQVIDEQDLKLKAAENETPVELFVANQNAMDFRVASIAAYFEGDVLLLNNDVAQALNINLQSSVRILGVRS